MALAVCDTNIDAFHKVMTYFMSFSILVQLLSFR